MTNQEMYLENKKLLKQTEQDFIQKEKEDKLFVSIILIGFPSLLIGGLLIILV